METIHKVGDIFQFENEFLKVVERVGCDNCYFRKLAICGSIRSRIGQCGCSRADGRSVQFVNIENL